MNIKLFFLLVTLPAWCLAQTTIHGNIDIHQTIPNVERNFVGFNSGQGNLEVIYNYNRFDGALEVNPNFYDAYARLSKKISWRFPGGTTASYYYRWGSGYGNNGWGQIFGDWPTFNIVDGYKRNQLYGTYSNYNTPGYANAKNNIIFPFINSITKNKTINNNAVFCINILAHYRNVALVGYDTRREMLRDTDKIKAIIQLDNGYLDAFNNSTLSNEFKKIVRQNIDAYLTLVGNNVTTYNVEIGNEIYASVYTDNLISNYNDFYNNSNFLYPSDTKVWMKDDGTDGSIANCYSTLWAYAHLAKLYRVLLTDTLQKLADNPNVRNNNVYSDHLDHIKFGVPISQNLNGGFKRWDDFMRDPAVKDYIGITAYIIHPYLDSSNYFKNIFLSPITNDNSDDLDAEFKELRDSLETGYNKRYFKNNHIQLLNALPDESEVWYTEWDFNFDHSNMKKIGNTLLHAMYYQDAMMNFFDINANKNLGISCNKNNPVKLCNYQISYARQMTWYAMTRFNKWYNTPTINPYTTTNNDASSIRYNAAYYAQLLLEPVLDDTSIQYLDNTNGGFDSVEGCSFRTFYKKDCSSGCCKDIVYLYFNNKTETPYSINLSDAIGISGSQCANVTGNYLYANNLYASMGQTTFRMDDILHQQSNDSTAADVTIQRVFNETIPDSSLNNLTIPKYSVGYIKAEITTPSPSCACGNSPRLNSESFETADETIKQKNIKTENNNDMMHSTVKMFPNPNTSGPVYLEIYSLKECSSIVKIYDLGGNLVKSFSQDLSGGENQLQFDLSDMAKSAYILQLESEAINYTGKLVLQ